MGIHGWRFDLEMTAGLALTEDERWEDPPGKSASRRGWSTLEVVVVVPVAMAVAEAGKAQLLPVVTMTSWRQSSIAGGVMVLGN